MVGFIPDFQKPCARLIALLTKIMLCILQVRAQEQPDTDARPVP